MNYEKLALALTILAELQRQSKKANPKGVEGL